MVWERVEISSQGVWSSIYIGNSLKWHTAGAFYLKFISSSPRSRKHNTWRATRNAIEWMATGKRHTNNVLGWGVGCDKRFHKPTQFFMSISSTVTDTLLEGTATVISTGTFSISRTSITLTTLPPRLTTSTFVPPRVSTSKLSTTLITLTTLTPVQVSEPKPVGTVTVAPPNDPIQSEAIPTPSLTYLLFSLIGVFLASMMLAIYIRRRNQRIMKSKDVEHAPGVDGVVGQLDAGYPSSGLDANVYPLNDQKSDGYALNDQGMISSALNENDLSSSYIGANEQVYPCYSGPNENQWTSMNTLNMSDWTQLASLNILTTDGPRFQAEPISPYSNIDTLKRLSVSSHSTIVPALANLPARTQDTESVISGHRTSVSQLSFVTASEIPSSEASYVTASEGHRSISSASQIAMADSLIAFEEMDWEFNFD